MTSERMAYDILQAAVARQRVPVYDLYGLLGVSPSVSEAGIRDAFNAIANKLQPKPPGSEVTIAYTILSNPLKRAQYDRDRLADLYTRFADHDTFSSSSSSSSSSSTIAAQIQAYAAALSSRVRDPLQDKKAAIQARIARTRADLDDFHDRSQPHRQDWATSPNQILRMAGNALREVVVCAEEDLCMLEDELGRLEGVLAPRDTDGPAGRLTSGQYGSEIVAAAAGPPGHPLLVRQRAPSLPRSPTMPVRLQSASKLGVQGEDSSGRGGSSPSEGAAVPFQPADKTNAVAANIAKKVYMREYDDAAAPKKPAVPKDSPSPSPSTLLDALPPPAGGGMGLVEFQSKFGARDPDTHHDDEHDEAAFWAALNFHPVRTDISDTNPLLLSSSRGVAVVSPEYKRPNRPWRTSTPPAAAGGGGTYGFHVARADERATTSLAPGGGGGLPSLARSAGIKDFQVRVWTAANAARAASGAYGGDKGEGEQQHGGRTMEEEVAGAAAEVDEHRGDAPKDVFRRVKGGAAVSGGRAAAVELDDPFT